MASINDVAAKGYEGIDFTTGSTPSTRSSAARVDRAPM
jgi:hypothetical protein